jgi:DNA-binding MarR family transcriptional regulator
VTQEQSGRRTRASEEPADDGKWSELADLALIISREIQYRGYTDERALSLTQSEGAVMRHLLQEGPTAPSRIAAAAGLHRTNLSTVLRGLESKGLIERQTNPEDRRGIIVKATELGRTNYDLVRREWGAAVAEAAGHDTTRLDTALALLTDIKEGMQRTRPPSPSSHPPA